MTNDTQKLIIITAPSGSGKTTIVNHLLHNLSNLAFSVSACTRSARAGEVHGVNYYFLSLEEFTRKIANHEFAEFEMVYEGKYYGTLKSELQRIWDEGKTPLVDIDVQGAMRLKKHYGKDAFTVFIQAPSLEVLAHRLKNRGTETAESLKERISKASEELTYAGKFDTIVVNDNLNTACIETENKVISFLN